MRALTRLDISENMLCTLFGDGSGTYNGAGVAALSDMLKSNSVLKELKMSKNCIGSEGAKLMSLGLSGNVTLAKLDISRNAIPSEQEREVRRICVAGSVELSI
jgi:Ran GTPase-activating protein (RanGAP) involved in mRNA processing and transport